MGCSCLLKDEGINLKLLVPFFHNYSANMLTFINANGSLLISGNTFYAKEAIKARGGRWNPASSSWSLPADLDTEQLRRDIEGEAISAQKAVKKKERVERKAKREYDASPEGMAAAAASEKLRISWCYEQKQKTGAYYWLCCADCEVIDWERKHTNCMKCAEYGNSFRVRGGIYTGT